MKKILKYGLKFPGGFILVILLIILLVSLLIQIRPVKQKIARIAENQASGFLNGNLTIGKIDGNFFTHLLLENVLLTLDNDTLAFVEELNLKYNLLSLFNNTINVHSVTIEKPYLYLEQLKDSTWNLQQLVEQGEETLDTTESANLNINISKLILNQGYIRIHSPDTIIPEQIKNLNTNLSIYWSEEKVSAVINNFTLVTEKPVLQLNQLTMNFQMNEKQAEISDFILRTAQNRIEGKAQYQENPVQKGNIRLVTDELHLDEFSYFLSGLTIPATPVLTLNGRLEQDSLNISLNMENQNQIIVARVFSDNLLKFLFGDSTIVLNYQLETQFNNIDPGHWTGDPELNYLINGNINASGQGIEPATAHIDLNAKLFETTIEGQSFDNMSANLELQNGNLAGVVQGNGRFGEFYLAHSISDLMGNPSYTVTINTNELDLAILTGIDSMQSSLNIKARIHGRSFDPKKISAGAELIVTNSSFQQINFDTLHASIQYADENIQIDSLWLQTESVTIEAEGNYNMNLNSDLSVSVNFEGLQEFENFIPVSNISTSGVMEAHISGMADSLSVEGILRLDSTRYDSITFESLRLLAHGQITTSDSLFVATAHVNNFDIGGFLLDSVIIQAEGSPDSVFLQTRISNQDLNTQLHAGIVPKDKLKITIPEWNINYKNQQWSMQQPPAIIEIDSINYSVENFILASDNSDTAQYISMQGQISRQGKEDFNLVAGNINIKQVAELMNTGFNGSGLFDMEFRLTGTSELPLLEGDFSVRNAEVNEYKFTTLRGNIDYSNDKLTFESLVLPQDSGRVEIAAILPLHLKLDTMGFYFSPDDSLKAQVLIQKFSLTILNSFNIPVETTGFLEGEVNVNGTAHSPDPNGNVRLVDASFSMREYGIDYRNLKLNLSFLRDRIELDTFQIQTTDGDVRGTGIIYFGSDFYKGDITDSKVTLQFNGFNPLNHRQFNMQVDGYAELKGEGENVVFGGDLKIPQAEFYLPSIFRLLGRLETKEIPKPILVQELENMAVSFDSIGIIEFEKEEPDSVEFDYFNKLKGHLRVRIPRNTWIKNDDMRLEISGELEVIKNAEFFELFGQVDVIRGQYELLGKVFVIEEGTVSFEGGEEMSFRMNINASYNFRNDQKVQQELSVNITGTPEIGRAHV